MRTAIVAGVLAGKPGNGGNAWSRSSFVTGLRRLGFDARFVENAVPVEMGDIDLLVNIGGHLTDESIKSRARVRVLIDDDPGYTQFWQRDGLLDHRLANHDHYYTFGFNIGRDGCSVPTNGIDWRPLRPPVVLDEWPTTAGVLGCFTTVASWRGGYGRVNDNGHLYGQKAHEFRRFAAVAETLPGKFEIALDIQPEDAADAELLKSRGWRLLDPRHVATPDDFRAYVQRSGAEFSVAQGIYVETACGWFSDRTTRYLASGKPALVQDTGFSRDLPTGYGLLTFTTLDEAVRGVETIARDYEGHAQAAREVAEQHFASDKVLGRLLDEVGL
jgi:hypothetical protein